MSVSQARGSRRMRTGFFYVLHFWCEPIGLAGLV